MVHRDQNFSLIVEGGQSLEKLEKMQTVKRFYMAY